MLRRSVVRRPAGVALLVGVAVVATATACTGGDAATDRPSAETAAPAPIEETVLADEIATQFSGDHPSRSAREEGRCFAGELLDRVAPEELRSAGLVGADGHLVVPLPQLSEDLATTWVTAQQACTDFVAASAEALSAQSKGKLDRERYTTCLDDALTEDEIRAGLVAAIAGDLEGEAVATLSDAQAGCATEALPES